nr:MAG TPA: hypothetical protein [Caudoviricetes sp.]
MYTQSNSSLRSLYAINAIMMKHMANIANAATPYKVSHITI